MNLPFLTGLAVGYVIGTRAGRERYEQLAESWREFTDSELMQQLRGEITKRTSQEGATGSTGSTGAAGSAGSAGAAGADMVTPPVVVGPGPADTGTARGTSATLPDVEQSTGGSLGGDTPAAGSTDSGSAKRLDPPAGE